MASAFDFAGGAISDIFGAMGDMSEAKAYGQAAGYAAQNAKIALESSNIQKYQAQRQLLQVEGQGVAAAGGNGLAGGGSAGDILRSSASQGALQQQVIGLQGVINENSYNAQAAQYKGMQGAANAAAGGGILGGIMKGIGAVASIAGFL